MNMTSRPLVQDLVKEAIAKDAQRAKIAAEGARQMGQEESSKEASASTDQSVSTDYAMKLAAAVEYATPLIVKSANVHLSGGGTHDPAAAPEGVSASNQKGHQPFVPGGQGKGHHQPPTNPGTQAAVAGAATQMENTAHHHVAGEQTTAMSGGKGKTASAEELAQKNLATMQKIAKHHIHSGGREMTADEATMSLLAGGLAGRYGAEKAVNAGHPASEGMMRGSMGTGVGMLGGGALGGLAGYGVDRGLGGHGDIGALVGMLGGGGLGGYGGYRAATSKYDAPKEASAAPKTLVDYFLQSTKVAEDANNPAHISAGPAVPPETSAAGEPGGQPVAGAPQGPTSLVGSNESAQHFKKNQAHSPRKAELRQYFNEPALSSQTDTTLQQAFAHTGEAGTKFASAPSVKTAAARAILMKLAEKTAGKVG